MGKAPEAMKTAYQSPGCRGEGDAILSRMRTRCRVLQDNEGVARHGAVQADRRRTGFRRRPVAGRERAGQ